MKTCPTCRDEFLDHVSMCPSCHETLVDDATVLAQALPSEAALRQDMLNQQAVIIFAGTRDGCREIEKELKSRKIACAVMLTKGSDEISPGGAPKPSQYSIVVRTSDAPACEQALADCFLRLVEREGQGQLVTAVVTVGDGAVTCPACHNLGELVDGACPECGLFLGAA